MSSFADSDNERARDEKSVGGRALLAAAKEGDLPKLQELLDSLGDDEDVVNWGDPDDYLHNPFIWASYKGHLEAVKLLVAQPKVDLNRGSQSGQTGLICASKKGHTDIVKLLVNTPGVDVNLAHNAGDTPLHWAAKEGFSDCVRALLTSPSIDMHRKNNAGQTPIDVAPADSEVKVILEWVIS